MQDKKPQWVIAASQQVADKFVATYPLFKVLPQESFPEQACARLEEGMVILAVVNSRNGPVEEILNNVWFEMNGAVKHLQIFQI